MDFAPPDVTGVGGIGGYYERYVSESESTDGEGDASGGGVGQRKQRQQQSKPQMLHMDYRQDFRSSGSRTSITNKNSAGYYQKHSDNKSRCSSNNSKEESSGPSLSSSASIFAKLAASWGRSGAGSSSRRNGQTVQTARNCDSSPQRPVTASTWKDVQEGDPAAYPGMAIEGEGVMIEDGVAQAVR